MTKKTKKTYTPAPTIPQDIALRWQTILEAASGTITMTEGARRLGMSRVHFQTLVHRALTAMVNEISPKAGGRPSKPEKQAELESELGRLKAENARLQKRVDTTDKMLEIASGFLKGTIRPTGRQTRTKPKAATNDAGDTESERRRVLTAIAELRNLGLSAALAYAVAGVSAATVHRWRIKKPTTRQAAPAPGAIEKAAAMVTATRGLIGAEALRVASGLSRRQAAKVKAETETLLETVRKASSTRIVITKPGVVRGFDAMHLSSGYLLPAGDACVPYRTSCPRAARYDAASVAAALDADFRRHGAPLVLRLDRARQHDAPEVCAVLDRHDVIPLHGPPYHPKYYGQLERQNREHRAWIETLDDDAELDPERMIEVLNGQLPRRTLGWRTAEDIWNSREPVQENRRTLRKEIEERSGRLIADGVAADVAERLAIERALEVRGYLRRKLGGWC